MKKRPLKVCLRKSPRAPAGSNTAKTKEAVRDAAEKKPELRDPLLLYELYSLPIRRD